MAFSSQQLWQTLVERLETDDKFGNEFNLRKAWGKYYYNLTWKNSKANILIRHQKNEGLLQLGIYNDDEDILAFIKPLIPDIESDIGKSFKYRHRDGRASDYWIEYIIGDDSATKENLNLIVDWIEEWSLKIKSSIVKYSSDSTVKKSKESSLGVFSVNDSVWIAAAVLSYERYHRDNCRTIDDFAFDQRTIRERAQVFAEGNVQPPRVAQWCCADQAGHYKSYLRAVNGGTMRRLTFPGELSDKPTEPSNIDKTLLVRSELHDVSIGRLFDFVHNEYAALKEATTDEYNPGITAEQWVSILQDSSVTTDNNLRMLTMMLDYGGAATCKQLSMRYGETVNFFNAGSSSYAKRVFEKTKCVPPPEEKNALWWPILYTYRYATKEEDGAVVWILRDELKAALQQIELPEIEGRTEMSEENKIGLNTILYGPPGTGKTYNSTTYAVAICDGVSLDKLADHDAVMERFNELKAQGRIGFTTFHQSYGYEEFIEGIKPVTDEETGNISYVVTNGVFKDFCEEAEIPASANVNHNAQIFIVRLNGSGDSDLKQECFKNDEIRFNWEGDDTSDWMKWLKAMKPGDYVLSYHGNSRYIDGVGIVQDDEPFYDETKNSFKWTRAVKWMVTNRVIDVMDANNGKYLSNYHVGRVPDMKLSSLLALIQSPESRYQEGLPCVFIIDEINRGNISKIFGELITLIEDTKRKGCPEELAAELPYSHSEFSVPHNVYILGTMNTADRSIALMDTALRRRFEFKEMMPDISVIEGITLSTAGETLDVAKMLETINARIEYLYDREHTIGHAFFTGLRENPTLDCLAKIFKNKVIPLLQEYFYEDYEKIQLVLGDNDKSDESLKFVLDKKVNESTLFKKNPQLDLHEKTYLIQDNAFYDLRSYIEIAETR